MDVLGYSERGVINSLSHEIAYSENPDDLFRSLISWVSFPFIEEKPLFGTVDILIEQSFSDFGDADALALISGNQNCSLFIEAKVKRFQVKDWRISRAFQEFCHAVQNEEKVSSSNLFTQLYHKVRLVKALREGGIPALKEGVSFPPCSTKPIRKIGSNEIVLKAAGMLETHLDQAFYIAIVPCSPTRVGDFFQSELCSADLSKLKDWDVSHFGYLTWSQVEDFCNVKNLNRTLQVFSHNEGQIY